jgi:hypothetical protein
MKSYTITETTPSIVEFKKQDATLAAEIAESCGPLKKVSVGEQAYETTYIYGFFMSMAEKIIAKHRHEDRKKLVELTSQLEAIEKLLPSTYYPDYPLEARLKYIIHEWRMNRLI